MNKVMQFLKLFCKYMAWKELLYVFVTVCVAKAPLWLFATTVILYVITQFQLRWSDITDEEKIDVNSHKDY